MADQYDPLANVIAARTQVLDHLSSGGRLDPGVLQGLDVSALQNQGEFTKGLRRAGYSMSAMGQAFAGQLLEPVAPEAAKAQFAGARRTIDNMPEQVRPAVESFDKVNDLRSAGQYALGKLGEGLPSTVATLGGGLVGRGLGAFVGRGAAGSTLGMLGTALPMEAGETAYSLQSDPAALANTTPGERLALSLGRGGINSFLETRVPAAMEGRLFGEGARGLAGVRQAIGQGMLTEGATEFAQDLTGQVAQNIANPNAGYNMKQALESGIGGAISGGVLEGASSIPTAVRGALPERSSAPAREDRSFKQRVDAWALKNLPEEDRASFVDAASKLSGGTAAQRKILSEAIASRDPTKIKEAIGAAAAMTDVKETAKAAGGWVNGVFGGFAENMKQRFADMKQAGEDVKESRAYTINDRKELLSALGEMDQNLAAQMKGLSSAERTQLANHLLTALDNRAYFENAPENSPQRKLMDAWQAQTGTDLSLVLRGLGETNAKFAAATPNEEGVGSSWNNVDTQAHIQQAALDAAKAQQAAEGKNFVEVDEGQLGNVEDPNRTPFNQDTVRKALVGNLYKNNKDTTIPVQFSSDDPRVTPSMIANVFGKKMGKRAPFTFESYKPGEVPDDKPFTTGVNPMSLAAMVKQPQYRDAFAADVEKFDPNMDPDEQAGRNMSAALATLVDRGIEISPQAFGLEGSEPIRIKVSANMKDLPDSLVLRRTGSKTEGNLKEYTLGDFSGATQREVSLSRQNKLLSRFEGDFTGGFQALQSNKSDRLSQRIAKIVYARIMENAEPGYRPTNQDLDKALAEYAKDVPERLADRARRDQLNSKVADMRERLTNGDISRDSVERRIEHFAEKSDQNSQDHAAALQSMLDRYDQSQARSESIQSGRADEKLDSTKEEFEMYKLQEQEKVNTSEAAKDLRDAKAGKIAPSKDEVQAAADKRNALRDTVMQTINDATTQLRLDQISARLKNISNQFSAEELQGMRDAWTAKRDKLKGGTTKESVDQGTPNEEAPKADSAARKAFVGIIERVLGKRVAVKFDQKFENGRTRATFEGQSYQEALRDVRNERRDYLNDLERAPDERTSGMSDQQLRDAIKESEQREQDILEDKAILGLIRVGLNGEQQKGLAEHEAFHGAFRFLLRPEERRLLSTAFTKGLIHRRLMEHFKDQPGVLDKIDPTSKNFDAEEAAAYGFQLWSADPSMFNLGSQVKSFFEKMKDFILKLFNATPKEEQLRMLLEDLNSGKIAERGTSPAQIVLDKNQSLKARTLDTAKKLGGLAMHGWDTLFTGMHERVLNTENPALRQIAEGFYSAQGDTGNKGGVLQRQRLQERAWRNRVDGIFRGLTDEQLTQLHDAKINDVAPTDPVLLDRFNQLTKLYEDLYAYQTEAGVAVKNAAKNRNYYPLNWSSEKVYENKDAFIAMLQQPKYAAKMAELRMTPTEVWSNITSYLSRGENLMDVTDENKEPLAASTNPRTLDFLDPADRRAFMDDSPAMTAATYIKQAVRKAEFVRTFGENGSRLIDLKNQAASPDKYGASKAEMKMIDDYIDGVLGNKGVEMSRELKDLYGAMAVYQNFRLLPLNLFSSLVDPMGVAIRSNDITDAWSTFAYSMKNLFRDLKENHTPDQWEKMAQDWGIIEAHGTMMNVDNLYDGDTMRGMAKSLNDKLFKYNLMNGWVRSNTIMAVKAANKFMQRAAEGFWGKEQSARYLEELGLSQGDVIYDADADRICYSKQDFMEAGKSEEEATRMSEKIRNATDKFVRQSLLNPSSPEMAGWASNPYLMPLAHLKQFVWAFNSTITKRVMHELDNGNAKPVAYAAMYVPAMIAADFMKDMIGNFGEEPPYKKDWTAADYLLQGVNRSGFTGTGQFFTGIQQDMAHGGTGLENFAGPQAEQLVKLAKAMGSGNSGDLWNWTVKAMPLMPLYDQALLTQRDTSHVSQGGGDDVSGLGVAKSAAGGAAMSLLRP